MRAEETRQNKNKDTFQKQLYLNFLLLANFRRVNYCMDGRLILCYNCGHKKVKCTVVFENLNFTPVTL